jgi:hypothetical protein
MTMFAIRHKPSGGYLPSKVGSGKNTGFTHTTPTIKDPPRLFRHRKDARMALRAWLEGVWYGSNQNSEIVPQPGRKARDMEIIEIEFLILNTEQLP